MLESGTGSPILFVHGFPLDHSMWKHQIGEFAKGYHVICPDLPGFGASDATTEPMSMKGLEDDLAKMLDALGVDSRVTFCGLSMGGYVGWEFWNLHSARLSGLVACDTRAASDSPEVVRARQISAEGARSNGSTPVADSMIEKLFYPSSESSYRVNTKRMHDIISNTDPESVAQGQIAMSQRSSFFERLKEIKIPTLFVVGEHDEITTPEEVRSNCELVENSKCCVVANSGHLSPLENPTEFNECVAEFLSTMQ